MTTASPQDAPDTSMLELFRSEVEIHTATMNEGLLILEKTPDAIDQFERLMRAAHSIKGGAKIMELTAAVEIAHVMEEYFVAAQRGQVRLDQQQIAGLLQSVELLILIAQHAGEGWDAWLAEQQESMNTLIQQLKGWVASPPQTPSQNAVSNSSRSRQRPGSPPQSAKKKPEPSQPSAPSGSADASMLELFRTEVETHVITLNEGLLALENDPGATDRYEALMRAAHSIKGGARVVELSIAVELAHVMEDCFVMAQKGELSLESAHIDILLAGVDLLSQMAEVAGEGMAVWSGKHSEEVEDVIEAITQILQGEMPSFDMPVTMQQEQEDDTASSDPTYEETPSYPADTPENAPRQAQNVVEKQPAPPLPRREVQQSAKTKPSQKRRSEEKDRMVRVTAAKIERLMGLAGEVVVSARWLPPFSESLLALKKTNIELFGMLEKLREHLGHEGDERIRSLILRAREKNKESSALIADRLNELDMFTSASASLSDRLYHEVIGVRMRPFADGVMGFPRMVRDLARKLGKKVNFEIIGKSTEVDRDILEKLDAPITHLLRNALDHGIETPEQRRAAGKPEIGSLRLEAVHRSGMLMITISDDGCGINLKKLRQKILQKGLASTDIVDQLTEAELLEFLFLPGFSTSDNVTEISGRGVGLDVVHDMVHAVRGVVRAVSKFGEGTSFHLELPLTLSVIRTFLVEISHELYAFPLARIDRCLMVEQEDIKLVEDRQYFRFDNANIALVDIHQVLELEESVANEQNLPVVVVSDRSNAYGLVVDTFVGECDLVVRPLDPRLGKIPDISAAAVMLDGTPVLIFDVEDLIRSIDKLLTGQPLNKINREAIKTAETPLKRILVVDDSITVREMERKLLESHGYEVEVAVDGMDGWNAVRTSHFDMVVSDVDMPRMNGIEFISLIKQDEDLKSIPVIIISYKDTEEHRLQGLEAGANYYLTKSSFQDNSFVNAVIDLIGEARS